MFWLLIWSPYQKNKELLPTLLIYRRVRQWPKADDVENLNLSKAIRRITNDTFIARRLDKLYSRKSATWREILSREISYIYEDYRNEVMHKDGQYRCAVHLSTS